MVKQKDKMSHSTVLPILVVSWILLIRGLRVYNIHASIQLLFHSYTSPFNLEVNARYRYMHTHTHLDPSTVA